MLLIYVALHALAVDPGLWAKHVEQSHYDKLLFREDDFRLPQKSTLRRDLLHSDKSYVRQMTESLFAAAAGSLEAVPQLYEIIEHCRVPAASIGGDGISCDPSGIAAAKNLLSEAPPLLGGHGPTATTCDSLTIASPPPSVGGPFVARGIRPTRLPTGSRPAGSIAVVAMPSLPGYAMVAEIGRGCTGTVFLARSEATGRSVVVKIAPIRAAATEVARRRFLAEIDRVAQVRHPNIVESIQRGIIGHAFFFVSEHCAGGNLVQWMESNGGALQVSDVRPIMGQCLDALRQAHLRRVIHGSIHPRNILFNGADPRMAKIADFGLARELQRGFGGPPVVAMDALAAGFIAPEQLTSQRGPDSRSDLWQLAAAFYYALSGCVPWDFGGAPPLEVIASSEPIALRRRAQSLSVAVAEVIDRALRPNPGQRYASAAEMKTAWETAMQAGS